MSLSLLLVSSLVGAAWAQSESTEPAERLGGSFGLGVALGAPTGFSGKLWMGQKAALQFSAGGRLGTPGTIAASVDYVVVARPFDVTDDAFTLPIYVGAGFKTDVDVINDLALMGPRAVGGVSVLVPDLPTEFFVEVAPTFYFLERVSWSVDGQMGVRYYF